MSYTRAKRVVDAIPTKERILEGEPDPMDVRDLKDQLDDSDHTIVSIRFLKPTAKQKTSLTNKNNVNGSDMNENTV